MNISYPNLIHKLEVKIQNSDTSGFCLLLKLRMKNLTVSVLFEVAHNLFASEHPCLRKHIDLQYCC
jgi:hypothetical protein